MTIKFAIDCNKCSCSMDDGEDSYCARCYNELQDEISGLKDDISSLESDKDELQQEKDDLTEKLMRIENEKERSDL